MKKILAILTFVLVTLTAAVAVDGPTLALTANIKPTEPEFIMKGGFSTAYGKVGSKNLSDANAILASDKDPSASPIIVYTAVEQSNKAKYKGTVSITMTATPLVNSQDATQFATVSATAATPVFGSDRLSVTSNASKSGDNAVASYSLDYNGKPQQSLTTGTAVFTWAQNADLPVGEYSATITLGVTIN